MSSRLTAKVSHHRCPPTLSLAVLGTSGKILLPHCSQKGVIPPTWISHRVTAPHLISKGYSMWPTLPSSRPHAAVHHSSGTMTSLPPCRLYSYLGLWVGRPVQKDRSRVLACLPSFSVTFTVAAFSIRALCLQFSDPPPNTHDYSSVS